MAAHALYTSNLKLEKRSNSSTTVQFRKRVLQEIARQQTSDGQRVKAAQQASFLESTTLAIASHDLKTHARLALLQIYQNRNIHPRLLTDSLLTRDPQPRFAVHLSSAVMQLHQQQLHLRAQKGPLGDAAAPSGNAAELPYEVHSGEPKRPQGSIANGTSRMAAPLGTSRSHMHVLHLILTL